LSSICIFPPQTGLGGPASFSGRLASALRQRGIRVHHDPNEPDCEAVLVIGGTRRLEFLWQARRRGVRIVQRLNGMNWLHRKLRTGLKHFLRSEINNWILAVIRSQLADRIIYQSNFSRDWWQAAHGPTRAASAVIYNGVDLAAFSPDGPHERPQDTLRLLMVEGHLGGAMAPGLDNAVELLRALGQDPAQTWELMVAGQVPQESRVRIEERHPELKISWAGVIQREQIARLDRSAHCLFSADINAACPNSVIEALACGLPVIAYATGALPEMVSSASGCMVPYGSNHWDLEPPLVAPLAEAARKMAREQDSFRPGARARAEELFDIQKIVDAYLKVIL
jgi:glycosyltransferase involved in cell wall biosynthesis